MSSRPWIALAVVPLLCATAPLAWAATPEQVAAQALAEAPVWDGHNDVPEQLRDRRKDVLAGFDFADTMNTADPAKGIDPMQTDLARLHKGHVGAQFWSVYVSATLPEPQAVQAVLEQIDVMKRVVAANPDTMMLATSSADVEKAMKQGKIASLLGMEGGHSIGSSLGVLRQMYALGARYMTLTHFKDTPWADSATDAPQHNGLTPFGKNVVREMQRIGMLVDLSHVSAKTMADALDVAKAPVIFSHSGAIAVDGHPRNVPDAILDRLKANGGIVMVNFYPSYVSEAVRQWQASRAGEATRQGILHPDAPEVAKAALEAWDKAHPKPVATLSDIADHIDHIVKRIGADHVGLGGDFDGGSVGVEGMPDVSAYPALFTELARRGYSKADLEKISSGNMMRVLKAAESYAQAHRADPPIESPTTF
ncbi:dipeptidase [Novosphingobium sp. 1949]|uniref:Dipeptidase n=1 Tax=Novosphingobium organovorum TaxID=2930092 RepID=A0ABT0BG27_9SPHN|nr:dipeptidase [Novosphingobium organovorum]MCJ2183751.1 dipeptidase [Novosphingobium organovorum]